MQEAWLKGPLEHDRRRKFRRVDELHKTLPRIESRSQVCNRLLAAPSADEEEGPAPAAGEHKAVSMEVEGAVAPVPEQSDGVGQPGAPPGGAAPAIPARATHRHVWRTVPLLPALASRRLYGCAESAARPSTAGEAGPPAGEREASPEWRMDEILSLRDRLSDDDRGTLQSIRKSHEGLPTYQQVVNGWIARKMREYALPGTSRGSCLCVCTSPVGGRRLR